MSAANGRDLRLLPKAHLHLHFTGSMRLATVLDLAERHGIRLPGSLRTQHMPDLSPDERGWFRFQRLYDAARSVVRGESDMRRIIAEAAEDDRAEGSRWLEIQIDPTSYAPFVGGITPALEIVLDEARRASDEAFGVGVIVAASRTRHPLEARTLARLAARNAGTVPGTVFGFGLSNDERRGVTADFGPAFRIAREAGLGLMPHGGELLGPHHVREVIEALQPDRLGHGVRIADDERLLSEVARSGIGLEICPGSNISLGVFAEAEQVPLRRLLDAGTRIALGADDPLLFGSRLVDQYSMARSASGLSDQELARLAEMSIDLSRAPDRLKSTARADIAAWLAT
ncbi:adenosine deaminase [Saxibacter everestensis]|uniref:Adenosine deaminase n=1 Tax=Saxibacter everestensis TaxID=2909229 RepID=A0ABY8QQ23_9MICO|nr:adenosine deaminase [Brevibacteriaceae bacterium ZFBP1038]